MGEPGHDVHRKRMKFSVVFGCVVLGVCLGTVLYIHKGWIAGKDAPHKVFKRSTKEPFTFENIFDPNYKPKTFKVHWLNDGNTYIYTASHGDIHAYDVDKGHDTRLIDKRDLELNNATNAFVSPDQNYILLAANRKRVWRHSYTAKYKIYDVIGRKVLSYLHGGKTLQYAGWSSKDNALTFVYENNLYYQPSPSNKSEQITTDGKHNQIYNGIPDWLYEEEIISSNRAHWLSASNSHICYAKFNDTDIKLFKMPVYGRGKLPDIYNEITEFPYPKVGLKDATTTKVSLYLYDIKGKSNISLTAPTQLDKDFYFTRVKFTGATQNSVMVVWTNRIQNKTLTVLYDSSGKQTQNFEQDIKGGWIEPETTEMYFTEDGKQYVTLLPKEENKDKWHHLALLPAQGNAKDKAKFLTSGAHEVHDIVGYNKDHKIVFFLGTEVGQPLTRHLFRVGTPDADAKEHDVRCLTCNMGNGCKYVSASFSSTGEYCVLGCLGPAIPEYTLRDSNGMIVKYLEGNEQLKYLLSLKRLPNRDVRKVRIGGGYEGWAELWYPPGMDFSGRVKYSTMVRAYNGPASQRVTHRYTDPNFALYLTSSENVVYMRLDGRGTKSRGLKFRHEMYKNMGVVEVEDQLLGGKYLQSLRYVDGSKLAIWGWSYGGFVTSQALANDVHKDVFQCGMSVNAIYNRKYYDTANAERYLGLYKDNEAAYNKTDILGKAKNFDKKKFLLIHATMDDNVHFLSAAHMMTALTEARVQYKSQVYIDKAHSIRDTATRKHLYAKLRDFLLRDCWRRHQK